MRDNRPRNSSVPPAPLCAKQDRAAIAPAAIVAMYNGLLNRGVSRRVPLCVGRDHSARRAAAAQRN
jgi:hypothetical protein